MGDTYIMAVFRIYTWREAHTYTRTVQRTESINTEEFSVGKYGFVLSAKRTTPCSPCAIRNVYVQNATQSQWIWSIRMKPNWQHHTQSQSHSHSFVRSFVRSFDRSTGKEIVWEGFKIDPMFETHTTHTMNSIKKTFVIVIVNSSVVCFRMSICIQNNIVTFSLYWITTYCNKYRHVYVRICSVLGRTEHQSIECQWHFTQANAHSSGLVSHGTSKKHVYWHIVLM